MTADKTLSRRELATITLGAAGAAALVGTPAFADQGRMRKALEHLEAAYDFLDKAAHDKGGHRVKAMEHVQAAINQTNLGIKAGA